MHLKVSWSVSFSILLLYKLHETASVMDCIIWGKLSLCWGHAHSYLAPQSTLLSSLRWEMCFELTQACVTYTNYWHCFLMSSFQELYLRTDAPMRGFVDINNWGRVSPQEERRITQKYRTEADMTEALALVSLARLQELEGLLQSQNHTRIRGYWKTAPSKQKPAHQKAATGTGARQRTQSQPKARHQEVERAGRLWERSYHKSKRYAFTNEPQ